MDVFTGHLRYHKAVGFCFTKEIELNKRLGLSNAFSNLIIVGRGYIFFQMKIMWLNKAWDSALGPLAKALNTSLY